MRQAFAHAQVVAALQGEVRQRVAGEGVDAERHHQRVGRIHLDAQASRFQRGEPAGRGAAGRQRQIDVVAEPGAAARFIGVAEIKRVFAARVGVDGGEQHVVALVKDALRAVAVVVVDIKDGDLAGAVVEQMLRGQGRVVEKTVAAKEIAARVMARRARQGERGALAQAQRVRRVDGAVGARLGRRPRAGRQRRAIVHRIQAQLGREVVRFDIAAQGAYGPHGGQGILVGIVRVERQPVVPGVAQEVQVTRRVDALQRRQRYTVRRDDAAQVAPSQFGHHHVGPFGRLEAGHQGAAK